MSVHHLVRPDFKAFEGDDGFVYTQCRKLKRGGYVCRDNGLYFRFKKYTRNLNPFAVKRKNLNKIV